ncbi:hypothetical protein L0337_27195 [candidate division KSB1 bacterium]|nr:hypothetical protein [candidate division KSB1 bacterium]
MSRQPLQVQRDLPSREAITQHQIHTLLAVVGTLFPYIAEPHRETNIPNGHKMDGEATASASTTFIKVCDRIDKIVEDESRWDLKITQNLEDQAKEVLQYHKALLGEQIIATKIMVLPHNRFRPAIYTMEDGTVVAELGDFIAAGKSPAEALQAWDMLFVGEIDPKIFEWLKQREEAIDEGTPPPPAPRRKKRKK